MSVDMRASLPVVGPSAAGCCAPDVGLDATLNAERLAALAKALSEPVRVQILDVLRRSPAAVCQCELVPLFAIPQSTLSHHVNKLVDAGLVIVERRHKWAYYSVAETTVKELHIWLS